MNYVIVSLSTITKATAGVLNDSHILDFTDFLIDILWRREDSTLLKELSSHLGLDLRVPNEEEALLLAQQASFPATIYIPTVGSEHTEDSLRFYDSSRPDELQWLTRRHLPTLLLLEEDKNPSIQLDTGQLTHLLFKIHE